MNRRIVQVDAFTAERFRGNPAAVCVLEEAADEGWMRDVAREMNLSETAYLVPRSDGSWGLRWFTPATEVDLCGHATLASAHVLWTEGHASDAELHFHTRSGVLTARREVDGIMLDFPAAPAAVVAAPAGLLEALGVEAGAVVARNRWDYLVEVGTAAEVRALQPDMARLAAIDMRGVIVTAVSDEPEHDFVSRWFGPRVGVPEDPVTGSAHCALGPWWQERTGRSELVGWQASARGGRVGVRMRGARVELVGSAVTVLRGELA